MPSVARISMATMSMGMLLPLQEIESIDDAGDGITMYRVAEDETDFSDGLACLCNTPGRKQTLKQKCLGFLEGEVVMLQTGLLVEGPADPQEKAVFRPMARQSFLHGN